MIKNKLKWHIVSAESKNELEAEAIVHEVLTWLINHKQLEAGKAQDWLEEMPLQCYFEFKSWKALQKK